MNEILYLFEQTTATFAPGGGPTRLAQVGILPPLPIPRCGHDWRFEASEAAAFLAEGFCPACGCVLDPSLTQWTCDQAELDVCIPYFPSGRGAWLGYRCRCCIAGWALVLGPERPAVVGFLP